MVGSEVYSSEARVAGSCSFRLFFLAVSVFGISKTPSSFSNVSFFFEVKKTEILMENCRRAIGKLDTNQEDE